MRIFENCVFEEAVVAKEDSKFMNCKFASGKTPKEKGVFALNVAGAANVEVLDCDFANKGYSAVYMNTTGKVDVERCNFDCTGLYNPIEGASGANGAALTEVVLKDNVMEGICGNNYFNFYHMAEGGKVEMDNNRVVGMSQQAEVIRLSNLSNANATFNVKNTSYVYDMATEFDPDWTKFILCQDYTGNKAQDFSKYEINIDGLTCNGVAVTDKDSFPVGGLVVVYDNKANGGDTAAVIDDNNPVINLK